MLLVNLISNKDLISAANASKLFPKKALGKATAEEDNAKHWQSRKALG